MITSATDRALIKFAIIFVFGQYSIKYIDHKVFQVLMIKLTNSSNFSISNGPTRSTKSWGLESGPY